MEKEELIDSYDFCTHHQVEFSFISSLEQSGLIELILLEEKPFIPLSQLQRAEQFVRMRYELDINLEGIEAISALLDKIKSLQQEISVLRNRLRLYETGS